MVGFVSRLDQNPKRRNMESSRGEACERVFPSPWPRVRPLKLSLVASVGWFSVCACSRAVTCRSDLLWPFPSGFAL